MKIKGKTWKFGADINTDLIIPARYLITTDPAELARHCLEDADPEFATRVSAGDIVVAGKNFGCGSSREHAPVALKAAGISCIIADSFARIFYRNAFNVGLPILESKEAAEKISEGDLIEVDLGSGMITNLTRKEEYRSIPVPSFMQKIISTGGLINYVAERMKKNV